MTNTMYFPTIPSFPFPSLVPLFDSFPHPGMVLLSCMAQESDDPLNGPPSQPIFLLLLLLSGVK